MYFLYEPFSSFIDKTPTIPNSALLLMNLINIFSLLVSARSSLTTISYSTNSFYFLVFPGSLSCIISVTCTRASFSALLFSSNAAFAKIICRHTYKRVRLDIDIDIIAVLIVVSRLSTTLVSRLVLNLREQNSAVAHLPTTVETEDRFQAALPGAQRSTTRTSVEDLPTVRPSNSARETNAIGASAVAH